MTNMEDFVVIFKIKYETVNATSKNGDTFRTWITIYSDTDNLKEECDPQDLALKLLTISEYVEFKYLTKGKKAIFEVVR